MSCSKAISTIPVTVNTTSTTAIFKECSGWLPITGLDNIDFAMNVLTATGGITAMPAIQLASVRTDQPDAALVVTSGRAGYTHYRETLTAGNKAFYRVGVMFKVPFGGAIGVAQISLGTTVQLCGQTLKGVATVVTPSQLDATLVSFFPVSGFLPIVGAEKLKAMFIVTDNESTNLKYQLAVRSAVDPNEPNPWVQVESGWTQPAAGNTSRNSTELALPTTDFDAADNSLMQLGVAMKLSGASAARATVLTMPAVRY